MALFAFTDTDVARLRRMLQWYEQTPQQRGVNQTPDTPRRFAWPQILIAKSTASISGTTGNPTSGSCHVYRFTSTGGTSDTGSTVTAYNFSKNSVAANVWLQLIRESRSGMWLINYEDCGST